MTLSERMEALRAKKGKEYKDEREAAWSAVKNAEKEFFGKHKKDLEDLNKALLTINAIAGSSGMSKSYSAATIGAARSFLDGFFEGAKGLHPHVSREYISTGTPHYTMEIVISDGREIRLDRYKDPCTPYLKFYFYGGDNEDKVVYGTCSYVCQIDTKEESGRYVALYKRAEEGIPILKKRIEEFMEALG